jgi:hypothetical protein
LVADSPEERVRQELISHLIGPVGCPPSLLAVEVSLQCLVGPSCGPLPRRRIDIVCYYPTQEGLKPLLLVECKAVKPRITALRQVNGYNRFLKAPAIALAWPGNIVICHKGNAVYQGTIDQMPSYEMLRKSLFHNFDLAYSDRQMT